MAKKIKERRGAGWGDDRDGAVVRAAFRAHFQREHEVVRTYRDELVIKVGRSWFRVPFRRQEGRIVFAEAIPLRAIFAGHS